MSKIMIIKNQDGYGYKYEIIGQDNKKRYVIRNGFINQNEALEAAKKSIHYHLNNGYSIEKQNPINLMNENKIKKPIHIKNKKTRKYQKEKPMKIKNLNLTSVGTNLLIASVYGTLVMTLVIGGTKFVREIKSLFNEEKPSNSVTAMEAMRHEINISDCDFSSLHILIRSAKQETEEISGIVSNQLNQLGVSNEIISKDSDLIYRINNALNEHPSENIILINLEFGLDNYVANRTVIMSDYSNMRQYPADTLAACLNASFQQYSLNSVVRSGELNHNNIRVRSYLENELNDNQLANQITQLTIDLPEVVEDEITRNDAAASIFEGLMRFTALEKDKRYTEIYYTSQYGDTVVSVASDYNIHIFTLEENSDIDPHKQLKIGDTLVVRELPSTTDTSIIVNNPFTTSNIYDIEVLTSSYVVQSGDTVTRIANRYGVKSEDIIVPSGDPNNIQVDEILYIRTYNLYLTHEKIDLYQEDNNYQM